MLWTCEETGNAYEFPVDDPPGKLYCTECGKMHRLTPGKLSPRDLANIEKLTLAAKEDASILEMVVARASAVASRTIKHDEMDRNDRPDSLRQLTG